MIVERIETIDGKTLKNFLPREKGPLPASSETLKVVREGLRRVVNHPAGTAFRVRPEGLTVYGKTGTAQVVGRARGEDPDVQAHLPPKHRDHAWFVAFWNPESRPGIAVAVLVEHGGHGSSVAAPVAMEIIRLFSEKTL